MKRIISALILWTIAGLAQADGEGLSAGQSAMVARTIAHGYAIQQIPQDVIQIQQGNGHHVGYGTNLNLNIGNYYGSNYGQAPRENVVNVRDVFQVCLHC